MQIFAIDPGNVQSAYVLMRLNGEFADGKLLYDKETIEFIDFAKTDNGQVKERLMQWAFNANEGYHLVIERIQMLGMPAGRSVFETSEWVGRFTEAADGFGTVADYVYRVDEKVTLCGNSRAKDANIRQALIDRYAKFDFKTGHGTKANPDTLYGFKADIWAALAVATTWLEQQAGNSEKLKWRKKV